MLQCRWTQTPKMSSESGKAREEKLRRKERYRDLKITSPGGVQPLSPPGPAHHVCVTQLPHCCVVCLLMIKRVGDLFKVQDPLTAKRSGWSARGLSGNPKREGRKGKGTPHSVSESPHGWETPACLPLGVYPTRGYPLRNRLLRGPPVLQPACW